MAGRGHGRAAVVRGAAIATIGGAAVLGTAAAALAQAFPFGAEFVLDARQLPGSKKVPSLGINRDGSGDIDLWCGKVKARFVVAANTVTIITGEPSAGQCPPDRVRADGDLMAALTAATNWRMDGEALIFTGGRTLRFLTPTN